MATNAMRSSLKSINRLTLRAFTLHQSRLFSAVSATAKPQDADESSSSFTFSSDGSAGVDDSIHLKSAAKKQAASSSVTMPMSFMTGSIVGKRFYNQVTTRLADDGNGWSVMLDYRTLKSPSKRSLKLPTLSLAKAIAAEWDYQQLDGIRPFTMPLMRLACTALERVPLTRSKIIDNLMSKFNQDLVFCRAPEDDELTIGVYERQVEKINPLLDWVKSEFGFKPVVYSCFFGGKQEEGLVKAVEGLLKGLDDCELASIDALTSASHSVIISIALYRGRLQIDEAIELIRLEEDVQIDKWGLVEGGHDVDLADLKVQISSAVVFLGLSRKRSQGQHNNEFNNNEPHIHYSRHKHILRIRIQVFLIHIELLCCKLEMLDALDLLSGIQSFGASTSTVQYSVASVELEFIIDGLQSFTCVLITAVSYPSA
ncbi:hypothetical protein V2J09_020831 [Rumex salicifolius]